MYGKITALGTKSGTAGNRQTERNRWIEERWRFLSGHIVRAVTRTSAPKEKHIIEQLLDDPLEGTSTPSPSSSKQLCSRHSASIDLTTAGGAEQGTDVDRISILNRSIQDCQRLLQEGRTQTDFTNRAIEFGRSITKGVISDDEWDYGWDIVNGAITYRNKKLMKARAPQEQRPLVPQPRLPHFYDQYTDRHYGLPPAMGGHPAFRAEQRHSPSPLMFADLQPARDPPLPVACGEIRGNGPFQDSAQGCADVNYPN
ncbi:uncharacterized protein LOC129716455 isoform X1 [Leucoraja erinacea]|uniref:uncharacterized protein LOC129716455 isoform X1 n=1 Tax=Leucoraja erinaceus TaxID=7782 RepID=UPI002455E878|nr:uncharacterized protein LOC129716455 isoform X1 [Leucoraja erinacea]XP_055522300.1 uncharacterized protein LOC129716455 isoform X1 [Leucoraja erinacea]